jgi:hypothetical protein
MSDKAEGSEPLMEEILAHGGDSIRTMPSIGPLLVGRGNDEDPTDSEVPAAPAHRLITRNLELVSLTTVGYRRNLYHVSRAGADFAPQSCGIGK